MTEETTPTAAPSTEALGPAVEALLLMAEEPVTAATLAEAIGVPTEWIAPVLVELSEFYDTTNRGFELRNVGGGWRLWTRPEHGPMISAWVLQGQHARLSNAALETLSVIAYLQPISRARVAAIRGVSVDGVIRTLLARHLIEEAGTADGSGAVLFVTTGEFLAKLGMASLDELPALAPHLPEAAALEAELAALAEERDAAAARREAAPDPEGEGDETTQAEVEETEAETAQETETEIEEVKTEAEIEEVDDGTEPITDEL